MEDMETVLMQIISYSGDCKSSCFEAMDCFQKVIMNKLISF